MAVLKQKQKSRKPNSASLSHSSSGDIAALVEQLRATGRWLHYGAAGTWGSSVVCAPPDYLTDDDKIVFSMFRFRLSGIAETAQMASVLPDGLKQKVLTELRMIETLISDAVGAAKHLKEWADNGASKESLLKSIENRIGPRGENLYRLADEISQQASLGVGAGGLDDTRDVVPRGSPGRRITTDAMGRFAFTRRKRKSPDAWKTIVTDWNAKHPEAPKVKVSAMRAALGRYCKRKKNARNMHEMN